MVKLKMMNRVNKELKLLENYYGKDKVDVRTLFVNELEPYVINVYKNDRLFFNIKITLPYDYPFKDPTFCLYSLPNNNEISTINYFDFFRDCSQFYLYKHNVVLHEHSCPCCYNKLCNRELSDPLLEISKDVQNFGIQFMRLRERYFLRKNINILNNLNGDVLNIILDFV